jgi:hypothetical protein
MDSVGRGAPSERSPILHQEKHKKQHSHNNNFIFFLLATHDE